MGPLAHLIQSGTSSIVLYPYYGKKALIFGLSVIMIDLDHFVAYYIDTRRVGIKGLLEYHEILVKNLDNYLGLSLFHTVECYLILFCLGQIFPDIYFVLAGFLFHHLLDQIQLSLMKRPFARAFSVVEYFIRRKNYFTSIDQVLNNISKKI